MTSDERGKGAFDTLTDHLRQEIGHQVQSVLDELAAAARADRDRAAAEIREAALREGRHQAEQEGRAALDAALAGARPAPSGAGHVDAAASERLVDAIRSIGRARSLSEILDTLVNCTALEAARAGVLLVRGTELRGWRFLGFGSAFDDAPSVRLSFAEAGIIAAAVRVNAAVTGDGSEDAPAPLFAALPPGQTCVTVPLALGGEVVAVLYADQGTANPDAIPQWPGTVEVLARHAARSLEAMTAFKAARALMERTQSSDTASAPGTGDGAGTDDDAAARRYAKLLVSEIKLYHEAAVVAGRRDGDLGQRLGGEIARARGLYEQRVPTSVRQRADYFHDELVRTLANGDARILERRT